MLAEKTDETKRQLAFEKAIDLSARRADEWFKTHADQRLRLFNFYILLVAASVAGFASTLAAGIFVFAITIASLLMVVTIAFKQPDRRVANLVKDAERAQAQIDELLSQAIGIQEIKLADISENKAGAWSYRKSFNLVFLFGFAVSIAGGAFAVAGMIDPTLIGKN